jgi:hypothetical protein
MKGTKALTVFAKNQQLKDGAKKSPYTTALMIKENCIMPK